jgi:hypothetical protein
VGNPGIKHFIMTVNEAMLQVAEKEAKKYGYIEVSKGIIEASKDPFWGNRAKAFMSETPIIVNACKYIMPVFEGENGPNGKKPRIGIDMHWGNPRLSVCQPDGTFACLTYKDGKFSDAQAFQEGGLIFALYLKEQIDDLIG